MLLCDCCGSTFDSRSRLKWHKRKHESDGPYQCAHCTLRFDKIQLLHSHVIEGNSNMNQCVTYCLPVIRHASQLICGICDSNFQVDCQMQEHMKRHVKDKLNTHRQLQIFKYGNGHNLSKNACTDDSNCARPDTSSKSALPPYPAIGNEVVISTDPSPKIIIKPTLINLSTLDKDSTSQAKPSIDTTGLKRIHPKPGPVLVPVHSFFSSPFPTSTSKFTEQSAVCLKSVGINTNPPTACRTKRAKLIAKDQCSKQTQTDIMQKESSIFDNPCLDVSLSSVDMHELQAMLDKPGDGSVAAAEEILQELVANNPADFRHDFSSLAANFNVDFSSKKSIH